MTHITPRAFFRTENHILSKCPKLAQTEYKRWGPVRPRVKGSAVCLFFLLFVSRYWSACVVSLSTHVTQTAPESTRSLWRHLLLGSEGNLCWRIFDCFSASFPSLLTHTYTHRCFLISDRQTGPQIKIIVQSRGISNCFGTDPVCPKVEQSIINKMKSKLNSKRYCYKANIQTDLNWDI